MCFCSSNEGLPVPHEVLFVRAMLSRVLGASVGSLALMILAFAFVPHFGLSSASCSALQFGMVFEGGLVGYVAMRVLGPSTLDEFANRLVCAKGNEVKKNAIFAEAERSGFIKSELEKLESELLNKSC